MNKKYHWLIYCNKDIRISLKELYLVYLSPLRKLQYMMSSALQVPKEEIERIAVLKKYNILDTPPDGCFDKVTKLAATVLKVPIAIVTIVDTDRIWFKSKYGIDANEIDREPGLCASAILSNGLYLVEDAISDPRTLSNPLVAGEFGLRFYAAVPLHVRDGYNLGTLCIIDKEPRTLSAEGKQILEDLAQILIDQLELRLEARTANFQQNQMLGIAAHDLKNPLATILMSANLIKEESAALPGMIHQLGNSIERASKRMTVLINELLESAKMQTSQIPLRYSQVDFTAIISRVAASNLVLANAKDQKLFVNIDSDPLIWADEVRLSEIVDNLTNNAIKYSPPGKSISVSLKGKDKTATLVIADQGPGLSGNDLQNLFLPFTRLSARPTGDETSTGLGLSIVKFLVEAHGGRIWAENNKDEPGARFVVELPYMVLQ